MWILSKIIKAHDLFFGNRYFKAKSFFEATKKKLLT